MRVLFAFVFLAALSVAPAFAADAPPSEASIHELLEVTHAHAMLDTVMAQTQGMMKSAIDSGMNGQKMDDAQKKIFADGQRKMQDLLQRTMSWDKMQGMYIDVYTKSFSQKEVNDMLTFYKSPSGQAVLAKMPMVMQQTMQYMRGQMTTLMPEIQKISEETSDQLRAYNAGQKKAAAD
jgi:hypothetical protein